MSLITSFPDSSGKVQYVPLILWPSIDSFSPGISFNGIAPKFLIPNELNFFFLIFCLNLILIWIYRI